jgi:hypothetical protein
MMEEDDDEKSSNTSTSAASSVSISIRAEQELEDNDLYWMILLTDVSGGVSAELVDLAQEDALVLERTEGELEARYSVDHTFVDQVLKDDIFMAEIKKMHEEGNEYKEKEEKKTYILSLHSAFENRYRYICALRVFAKRRWLYLSLNAEREGLTKFFMKQCDRFSSSVPNVAAFQMWSLSIEDIKSMFSEERKMMLEKAKEQQELAETQVADESEAAPSPEPVVRPPTSHGRNTEHPAEEEGDEKLPPPRVVSSYGNRE